MRGSRTTNDLHPILGGQYPRVVAAPRVTALPRRGTLTITADGGGSPIMVSVNSRREPLEGLQLIIDLITSTTTSTGLKVYARSILPASAAVLPAPAVGRGQSTQ